MTEEQISYSTAICSEEFVCVHQSLTLSTMEGGFQRVQKIRWLKRLPNETLLSRVSTELTEVL